MKGGKREGAGRKPKDVELKELELIDSAINQADLLVFLVSHREFKKYIDFSKIAKDKILDFVGIH